MNAPLLTEEETAKAGSQGWRLCHIYDCMKEKWFIDIAPVWGDARADALNRVVLLAKQNDATCLKALRLIYDSKL